MIFPSSDFACTLKQPRFPTFCFWLLLCITDFLDIYAFPLHKMMFNHIIKGDYWEPSIRKKTKANKHSFPSASTVSNI